MPSVKGGRCSLASSILSSAMKAMIKPPPAALFAILHHSARFSAM